MKMDEKYCDTPCRIDSVLTCNGGILDEKYFEEMRYKIGETFLCFDPVPANRRLIKILKQVAHDARIEQARVDREAVEKMKLDKDATSGYVRGVYAASAALDTVAPKEEK